MEYYIDRRINLTALANKWNRNGRGIRQDLIWAGLNFAEANQFSMFAVYGFMTWLDKRTMTHANAVRLSLLAHHHT